MPLQKRKLSQSQIVLKRTSQLEYKPGHISRQNHFAEQLSEYRIRLIKRLQAHCSRLRQDYSRSDRQRLLFSGCLSSVFPGTPISSIAKRMGIPATIGLSRWEAESGRNIRQGKSEE